MKNLEIDIGCTVQRHNLVTREGSLLVSLSSLSPFSITIYGRAKTTDPATRSSKLG